MTPDERGLIARHAMPGGHCVEVGSEVEHGWIRVRGENRAAVLELRIEDGGVRIVTHRGVLRIGATDRPLHIEGSSVRLRARDSLRLESEQDVVVDASSRIDLWTGER